MEDSAPIKEDVPATPLRPETKIWRYMDLQKFVSILSTGALYFACPTQFSDPYEGYLPKSHWDAFLSVLEPMLKQLTDVAEQLPFKSDAQREEYYARYRENISKMEGAWKEAMRQFGVSCWHMSEYESEALWRLYSSNGLGVAIESTVGQLQSSLEANSSLRIAEIRYEDFETAPITKGFKHYSLFIKRKSFEHEKELRATIKLTDPGKGVLVRCDIAGLVNRVHVSPLAPAFLQDVIKSLCAGSLAKLDKPVIRSALLDPPPLPFTLPVPKV